MKLLIYVNPRTSFGGPEGPVNYDVSAALAEQIADQSLDVVASKFVMDENLIPSAALHRLSCAAAKDEAVLDALGNLKHRINRAKSWARAALLDRHTREIIVPDYVEILWEKFPRALYRPLLGEEVAEAVRQATVTPT